MAKEKQTEKKQAALKDKREVRVLAPSDVELRISEGEGESPKITGYAAKYNKWSVDLGYFREKIRPGAFDAALEESDVRALKNHDSNLILGRTTSGTLRLESNSVGLKFECDVPNTTTGADTVEEIRRGDLSGCSFAFTVLEDDWRYKEDDMVERIIIKVGELFDVGPVTYPAYPDTTVAARSLEAFKREHQKPEEDTDATETVHGENTDDKQTETNLLSPERQKEIERGYRKAGRIINRCRSAND